MSSELAMSDRIKKFSEELDELIKEGEFLALAIEYDCKPEQFRRCYIKVFKDDDEKLEAFIKKLPSFGSDYQKWYSKAQALVKQVLPDRLADLTSHYEFPRVRKDIDFQNYRIRDYLQGLKVTRYGGSEFVADGSAAIPEFLQQLNIVKAAKDTLSSRLMDLTAVLQADLFDSEVETAGALAKAGYLRAAGAICGVIIEKHLRHVCDMHNVTVQRKNPGISDLSQLLKDASVLTVPQWRFIQHLADIRNICDHAKGREPTNEQIEDLVSGTEKVLKTVF